MFGLAYGSAGSDGGRRAPRRVPCVGGLVTDDAGRLLLVRRAHAPGAGLWSVPGGHVQPGETDEQALRRELREETGLSVSVGALVGRVERPGERGSGVVFDIADYSCSVDEGTLTAGDDASDARFVAPADLASLPTVPQLVETLRGWGYLAGLAP